MVVAILGLTLLARRWDATLVIGLVGVGVVGGLLLVNRHQAAAAMELPRGEVTLLAEALADGDGFEERGWVPVRVVAVGAPPGQQSWDGPAGLLRGDVNGWRRGGRWWVRTAMKPMGATSGRAEWRRPIVWQGEVREAQPAPVGGGWVGERVQVTRSLILSRLDPARDSGRALLAGFLLGDTSHLRPLEVERMRRAGLSHFVAVSGSNVALFLGALFLAAGPLGWSSWRRAVLGVAGLGFFVLLIGPDPSVVRAATMAGLVLVARPFGLRPDIWRVIAIGVGLVLLTAPELAFSLGFQLSVAATAGVVIGAGWFRGIRPEWIATALGASCGAQLAVAPILLLAVSSIPLWSPAANVAAAPLVVAATGLGGLGAVTGLGLVVGAGAVFADGVLMVAELAADLPQLGPHGALLLVSVGSLALWRRVRAVAVLAVVVVVCIMTVSSLPHAFELAETRPAFVALDVGQGDALLLLGGAGETVLVDGGSSGTKLREGLSRFGVRAIDLLVISHAHHDHYGGLADVVGEVPIKQLWYAPFPGQGDAFGDFIAVADHHTEVVVPAPGEYRVGSITIEVLGPPRRYASLNDQSLVLRATMGHGQVLLSGDIERIAQGEMAAPAVTVLKVPHQGAATSDPDWLIATGASVAVVSVGPNRFGHPSEELLAELEEAGMEVRRTDLEGDVVIHF